MLFRREPNFVAANGAEPVKKKIEKASENLVKLASVELPAEVAAAIKQNDDAEKNKAEENKNEQKDKKGKKKGEKETENEGNVLEIGNITDSQLDPVYIQSLLDRIASLKEDGSVDKNEIRRLSDELDAIMLKLRQKNEKVNN